MPLPLAFTTSKKTGEFENPAATLFKDMTLCTLKENLYKMA